MTTVLDGGLATELEARGHDLSDRLWSARLLLSQPDAIEEVHLAYFRAGARVAITASYQASVEGFAAAGLDRATALDAIRRSVEIAQRARERFREEEAAAGRDPGRVLVAGSVGPYGAMLADGSEYRGDYDPGDATLAAYHRRRIDALVAAGADLLAVETIPTVREARVLVRLLDETGVPAWISYTGRDGATTAAGEPFAEAIALAGSGARRRCGGRQLHRPTAHARAAQDRAAPQPTSRSLPIRIVATRGIRSRAPGAATRPGRGNPPSWPRGRPSGRRGSAVVAAPDPPTSSDWPQR